jgi:hypothetical protein
LFILAKKFVKILVFAILNSKLWLASIQQFNCKAELFLLCRIFLTDWLFQYVQCSVVHAAFKMKSLFRLFYSIQSIVSMLTRTGKNVFNGIVGLGSKGNLIKRLHRQITKQTIINFSDPSSISQDFPALLSRFSKGPFKYYVSMFLAFLGPPNHLHQHK